MVANLPAPRTRLKGIGDGIVGADGKVLKEEEVSLGKRKVPGNTLLIKRGEKHERVHILLDGDRLYVVRVTGSKDAAGSKEADRFLGSFELK